MLLDDALQYCQLSPNKSAILNYGNRERVAIVDDVVAPLTEREPYALLRVRTSQGWQFIEGACVEVAKTQGREQGYEDLIGFRELASLRPEKVVSDGSVSLGNRS